MSIFFKIGTGILFLCFLCMGYADLQAGGDEIQNLPRDIAFREAELALAAKPGIYLLLDLENHKIEVKAKGVVLKEFIIEQNRFWGDPVPVKPLVLIKKSSFVKPERITVTPGTTVNPESFQIEALELDDMPLNYTLNLADGIAVNVKPKSDGILSALGEWISCLASSIFRPVSTLSSKILGQPFTKIDLSLSSEDSQALYWTFTEGMETIILTWKLD